MEISTLPFFMTSKISTKKNKQAESPYDSDYYTNYYVNPLHRKTGIANIYYLWLAYFCIVRPARLKKGARILDFGCGIGNMVWALRALGMDAHGIDPSVGAAEFCRVPDVCIYEDTQTLPYSHAEFDVVMSVDVLEHLTKSQLSRALDEMKRVSKDKMIHIVSTKEKGRIVTEEPTHLIIEDETWWAKTFRKSGFKVSMGNLFYFFPHMGGLFSGETSLADLKTGYFQLEKK